MVIRIAYLADHPSLAPTLADWFYEEWGGRRPEDNLENFTKRLQSRMKRNKLPITLVAFLEGELIGTAALKIREMETHPQYKYWLGSVYIRSQDRGKGYGTELVQATMREAARFEIKELFLYTRGGESFYSNLGWKEIERPVFRGRTVTIMKYQLY